MLRKRDQAMTSEAELSPPLRLAIFSRSGGICAVCGKRIDGTREPWAPRRIINPDGNTLDRLHPAHIMCPGKDRDVGKGYPHATQSRSGEVANTSKRPLPFGRTSAFKRKIDGRIVKRDQDR
jgi:hypothetical protein